MATYTYTKITLEIPEVFFWCRGNPYPHENYNGTCIMVTTIIVGAESPRERKLFFGTFTFFTFGVGARTFKAVRS